MESALLAVDFTTGQPQFVVIGWNSGRGPSPADGLGLSGETTTACGSAAAEHTNLGPAIMLIYRFQAGDERGSPAEAFPRRPV